MDGARANTRSAEDTGAAAPLRHRASGYAVAALAAGAFGALLVRVHGLGDTGLWLDEAYSARLTALGFGEIIGEIGREATPPLYYLLLGAWVRLAGASEWGLRALSMLLSLIGIAVIVRVCWQHVSPRAAVFALLFVAFAPIHIYYAQEARMYALLGLLTSALAALALRALETPTRRAAPPANWIFVAAGAVTLLALLTHNVAAWAIAGIDVAFVSLCREARTRRRWLAGQAFAAVGYLPWFAIALGQIDKQAALLEWFAPFWAARSLAGHALDSVASFGPGPFPAYLALGSGLAWGGWVAVGALATAARGGLGRDATVAGRFLAITLAVGFTLSLGYSAFFAPVHIPGRTDHAFHPLFAGLLAIGLARLRPKLAGTALAASFALLMAAQLPAYYRAPEKRASAAWVDALVRDARPGDVVIAAGLAYAETVHRLVIRRPGADPIDVQGFPLRLAGAPGYLSNAEIAGASEQLAHDADALALRCGLALARGARCFAVLAASPALTGPLEERLTRLARPDTVVGDDAGAQLSLLRTPVRVLRFSR